MKLIYQCQRCGAAITIYQGDPIGVPFGQLPEAIAQAMNHKHEERQ